MRAGLPVIASDLPGIREQLDDGACGLLVASNDEHAWSGAAGTPGGATPPCARTWDALLGPDGRGSLAWRRWPRRPGRSTCKRWLAASPPPGAAASTGASGQ
ncbi:glycosyltransferase [Cupriavidus basilensis]